MQARVRERYLWPRIAAEIGRSYSELTERTSATEAYSRAEVAARETSEQVG